MFEDIKYIREAGAITQNADYDLSPDKRIWLGLLCILAGTLLLRLLVRGRPRGRVRAGLCAAGVLLAAAVSGVYADEELYDSGTQNFDHINRWSATQLYLSKGFLYPFLHSVTEDGIQPPEGYDETAAEALLDSYTDQDIPEERKVDSHHHPAGGLCRFLPVPGGGGHRLGERLRRLPRPGGGELHRQPHHQHLRRRHRGHGAGLPHRLHGPVEFPDQHQLLRLVLRQPGLHRGGEPPQLRLVLQPAERQRLSGHPNLLLPGKPLPGPVPGRHRPGQHPVPGDLQPLRCQPGRGRRPLLLLQRHLSGPRPL